MKGVAKASEKAAQDIGHAAVDLGDKARKSLEDATEEAGGGGQAAWITTKVKGGLTRVGLDPLHVHVDTTGKVVTLSGTVESAADRRKAVSAAKAVKGVLGVQDHLFVNPAQRQLIPEQIQRAMGRQAEAEREKRAKVIAAEGEMIDETA